MTLVMCSSSAAYYEGFLLKIPDGILRIHVLTGNFKGIYASSIQIKTIMRREM